MKRIFYFMLMATLILSSCVNQKHYRIQRLKPTPIKELLFLSGETPDKDYDLFSIQKKDMSLARGSLEVYEASFGPGYEIVFINYGLYFTATFPAYMVTFVPIIPGERLNVFFALNYEELDKCKILSNWERLNLLALVVNRHFTFNPVKDVVIRIPEEEIKKLVKQP